MADPSTPGAGEPPGGLDAAIYAVFKAHLARHGQDEAAFEALCDDHPAMAAALRSLFAQAFGPAPSIAVAPSVRLGRDDGRSVSASEPDAGDPPSSRILRRLADHRAPGGRYVLRGEIKSGGQGTILRVHDGDLGRDLAMKVILGQAGAVDSGDTPSVAPAVVARFLEEAQVTARLDH